MRNNVEWVMIFSKPQAFKKQLNHDNILWDHVTTPNQDDNFDID
jgi:hypothetical protein